MQSIDINSSSIRQPDTWDTIGPYAVGAAHVVDGAMLVTGVCQVAKIGIRGIVSALAKNSVALEETATKIAVGQAVKSVGVEGGAASAHNVVQLERLRASLAAKEITDAERVASGLKDDPMHRAASFLSKQQLEAGRVFGIRGGDGLKRTLLQTPGSIDGQSGIFEFILEPHGVISHQRFIRGGRITGLPNQIIR